MLLSAEFRFWFVIAYLLLTMLLMLVKLMLSSPVFLMSSISDFIDVVRILNEDRSIEEVRFDISLIKEPVY